MARSGVHERPWIGRRGPEPRRTDEGDFVVTRQYAASDFLGLLLNGARSFKASRKTSYLCIHPTISRRQRARALREAYRADENVRNKQCGGDIQPRSTEAIQNTR
jgi:hypothetical protein